MLGGGSREEHLQFVRVKSDPTVMPKPKPLTVPPVKPPDPKPQVESPITPTPPANSSPVTTTVTLDGEVDSWAEAEAADSGG